MSTLPENEFDLEKLFLPAWAQEPSSAKSYANYQGEERSDREGRRGPRPPRREGGFRERRPEGRPGGERRGPRPDRPPGDRGNRPGGEGRPGPRGPRGDRNRPPERREPQLPLPEINLSLVPDDKGVEFLARQIKMTGRAYPLFDIAQMILQKPERHSVIFSVKKNAEGQIVQPLFLCALDDTLWLSEEEAVGHVLKKHFATFYQAERTATEPPKGKYTFVAQCGISGVILGPPNLHDYQNQLRKLHTERFSRMPFEAFKSRVRIVRDEEVVKKWVEEQSWKTDYICLNVPEPTRLDTMEAVEKHFRENHKDNIIKPVETHKMSGTAARNLRSPNLVRLVRTVWEDQRRFPLQIATVLSQQFASQGLQFFKVNKTITHVSVARPHYLDLDANPVSEGVKKIVTYINANPKCTRRQMVAALAPAVAPPPAAAIIPVPVPTSTDVQPAPSAETTSPAPAPTAPQEPAPTAEQTAVIADLHWLIHQGHVIEFANGTLETAKKPVPKPVRPEKPSATPVQGAAAPSATEPEQTEAIVTIPPSEAPSAAPAEPPAPAEPSGTSESAAPASTGTSGPVTPDAGPFTAPAASATTPPPAGPEAPVPTTDPIEKPPSDPKI